MINKPQDIILDCDPGIDDALAIILAIKSKRIFLKAITTVAGNTSIKNTATNALKILELVGITEIPVYRGEKQPLEGNFLNSEEVHGKDGLAENDLNSPSITWEQNNAVDFMVDYTQKYKKQITLV